MVWQVSNAINEPLHAKQIYGIPIETRFQALLVESAVILFLTKVVDDSWSVRLVSYMLSSICMYIILYGV
jgi:hypothetical protein